MVLSIANCMGRLLQTLHGAQGILYVCDSYDSKWNPENCNQIVSPKRKEQTLFGCSVAISRDASAIAWGQKYDHPTGTDFDGMFMSLASIRERAMEIGGIGDYGRQLAGWIPLAHKTRQDVCS